MRHIRKCPRTREEFPAYQAGTVWRPRIERYFFHLEDGFTVRDTNGLELPTRAAAHRAAIRFAGEVLKEDPERLNDGRLSVVVSSVERPLFAVVMELREIA